MALEGIMELDRHYQLLMQMSHTTILSIENVTILLFLLKNRTYQITIDRIWEK